MSDTSQVTFDDFPEEILVSFTEWLDWRSLIRFGQCNKRLNVLCTRPELWKLKSKQFWLKDDFEDDSPMCIFRDMYKDWGKYIAIYVRIRKLWSDIFRITKEKIPKVYESLLPGVSEQELDEFETDFLEEYKFPLDVRCSFRICNGQDPFHNGIGLLGSGLYEERGIFLWSLSKGRREMLGSGCSVPPSRRQPPGIPMFIEQCAPHPCTTLLCLGGQNHGKLCVKKRTDEMTIANFIAPSLIDFLELWVTNFEKELFVVDRGIPIMSYFYNEKRTGDFLCKIWTCPLWSAGGFEPEFVYTYRVQISMDENAPDCDSCRLDTRHWIINWVMGGQTLRHNVDGPGVVGEHPVLKPGSCHIWQSFTTFPVPYGIMTGHFKMDRLNGMHPPIQIQCAPMHFKPVGELGSLSSVQALPEDYEYPAQWFQ